MHFERTRHYYEAVKNYRNELRNIWSNYESELNKLKPYEGSEGYQKDKQKIDKALDESVKALQEKYRINFSSILDGMRESATSRPMIPPTADELSILQALKMREKVSRNEIEQASISLKKNPLCLSVLQEIAEKNEIRGLRFGIQSTTDVMNSIDALAESAKRLCALDKCDSRKEMIARASIHSPEHDSNALYSFSMDRDFVSEEDALTYLGNVTNLTAFREAVNE